MDGDGYRSPNPRLASANRRASRSFQRAEIAVGTVMGFGLPDEEGGLVVVGGVWRVSALARGQGGGGFMGWPRCEASDESGKFFIAKVVG